MPTANTAATIAGRLRANTVELCQLLSGVVPSAITRTDSYRRLRRGISRQPARFGIPIREIPTTRDIPGASSSWRGRKLVTAQTDLVIEGFPGSANSFVANAVRVAIDQPANVESHFHQAVQLDRAVALGVPTVVVVRTPGDACRSLKSKSPALFDVLIVLRWLQYHRTVLRHLGRGRFDIVLFDEVIDDVDVVRRRSAGMRRLVARPLVGDQTVQRRSRAHSAFGEGAATKRLLVAASRLYARIAGSS